MVPANLQSHRAMQYLVDTDWAIDYLRNVDVTVDQLEELAPSGIGISIISVGELYEGIFASRDQEKSETELRSFLDLVEVLFVDETVSRIFGRERRRLRAAGTLIPDLDLLIGATAIRHNLTILTNNRRHFERLEGLRIFSVIDANR